MIVKSEHSFVTSIKIHTITWLLSLFFSNQVIIYLISSYANIWKMQIFYVSELKKNFIWQFVTRSRDWSERANINTDRWKIEAALYEQMRSHMKLNWIRDLATYRDEKKRSWRTDIWNSHLKINETLWTFEKILLSIKKIRCMFWRKSEKWIQIFISTKFWNR